jgi:hypothetical protein
MRNLSAEKDRIDLSYKLGAAYREGKQECEKLQTVIADKDAVIADKDAEIARLRAELEQIKK